MTELQPAVPRGRGGDRLFKKVGNVDLGNVAARSDAETRIAAILHRLKGVRRNCAPQRSNLRGDYKVNL